jgi:hypothetical protein
MGSRSKQPEVFHIIGISSRGGVNDEPKKCVVLIYKRHICDISHGNGSQQSSVGSLTSACPESVEGSKDRDGASAGRPARVVWEVRFAGDRREYWDPAEKQVMDYVTHSRTQRGKPLSAGR